MPDTHNVTVDSFYNLVGIGHLFILFFLATDLLAIQYPMQTGRFWYPAAVIFTAPVAGETNW
jgi:hypothetical protein